MPIAPFESFTRGGAVKDLYGGYPAYVGVRAAELAASGIAGPTGFFAAAELDPDEVDHVYIKPWPSCRSTHAALTAFETLLPLVRPVVSIHVETYRFAAELTADADPSTPIGAKTSIPQALEELAGQPLADRVAVTIAPRQDRFARVTVRFDDGTEMSAQTSEPRSETDVRGKLRRLAGDRAAAIEAAVDGLEDAASVRNLVSTLGPAVRLRFASARRRSTPVGQTALDEMASWAVATESIPDAVAHAARRVLMDQVGVSHAGVGRIAPLARGEPTATVWSTGDAVFAPDAALANRFAGDDLELTAGPEIGAAAVAAGELADRTLGDVLVAMAVASELESYLRGWLQIAVERHELHPPAVFGAFAATAVASKLLGLDRDRFAGALAASLALTPQSPYASFAHGATGKWLYGAWSQKLGVQCALWARAGMTGARSTLEGRRGIAQALLHELAPAPAFRPNVASIANVTFKPFPCSRACHPALTAIEHIGPIDSGRIERIEVWSYPFSVDLEERSTKSNPIAAQMSISAMVARTLGTGAPVTVRREGTDGLPRVRRARVRITLTDGTVHERASEAKWSADSPATDDELRERFVSATRGRRVFDPWDAPATTPVGEVYRG
jgi:2-methylcitrate dehydratase PrpD